MLAVKASFSANKTISRTFEIYLPPVPSKLADPNTNYEYMLYLQSITAKVNLKYSKITLDVGAAIKTFKQLFMDIFRNILQCSPSYWRLSLFERKLQRKF